MRQTTSETTRYFPPQTSTNRIKHITQESIIREKPKLCTFEPILQAEKAKLNISEATNMITHLVSNPKDIKERTF